MFLFILCLVDFCGALGCVKGSLCCLVLIVDCVAWWCDLVDAWGWVLGAVFLWFVRVGLVLRFC